MPNYWLMKSEPFKYGWDDLVAEKEGVWDGVRNHRAKNNLQAPWLAFTAFTVFAVMLSLLIFIFEGIRDAFDPRKTFS